MLSYFHAECAKNIFFSRIFWNYGYWSVLNNIFDFKCSYFAFSCNCILSKIRSTSGNIMARGTCHNREKMSKEWLHFVILFHTFLQNISHISAIESHSQGKNLRKTSDSSWTEHIYCFSTTLTKTLVVFTNNFMHKQLFRKITRGKHYLYTECDLQSYLWTVNNLIQDSYIITINMFFYRKQNQHI